MSSLDEADFYSWSLEQAGALRRAAEAWLYTPAAIDWENIAEELEGLARSEAKELRSRYRRLLLHLLKWRYQPERRTRSWKLSIGQERDEIPVHLTDNPGLAPRCAEVFEVAYGLARREAARQTDLALTTFPETSPFTLDQAMDESFWPE